MDEATKKKVKIIAIITLILLIIGIILVFVNEKQEKIGQEEGNLPRVDKAEYNKLQTSADDFSALEEATNSLS